MARRPRKHQLQDEIFYHFLNRGNRKLEIFHDNEDYQQFKTILLKFVSTKTLVIYHYILIPNHYHIEGEIKIPEHMSKIFAGINRAYSHYYHKKYKTSGYLWQGRFKSQPIEKNSYSIYCGKYIEMNAVRAALVQSPEKYLYSSAKYYILGKKDPLISEDPNYQSFGTTINKRQQKYLEYLTEEDNQENLDVFRSNLILGSTEFKKKLCKKDGRWVPRRQGKCIFKS